MAVSSSRPSWLATAVSAIAVLTFASPVHALYFYVEPRGQRCFYEEMPKETLVVGNYKAETLNPQTNTYVADSTLSVMITVDETFDNDHRIVSQRGADNGRFTFTTADSGEHRVCFTPNSPSTGWISGGSAVKFTLDMITGDTSDFEPEGKEMMEDLAQRVKHLHSRLQDIRREQVYQREREAMFRDQSETTNSRVMKWAIIQTSILIATCVWQLTHLRTFFIKQKLT